MQAARYSLLNNDLYKRTYGGPLEKCLGLNQTHRILEKVHKDHCGAHSGARALVRCLIRVGGSRSVRPSARTRGNRHHMENIICRFSLPKEISCDNRPQFTGKTATEFFKKWHIKRILSTTYHPAGNGQAESSNKSILNNMKKKLEETKGLWPEILSEVLWAHRTTPKTSIGATPYSLVYEIEAIISVKVREPSLRYFHDIGTSNDESSG
nr:uncharacterized protein LOC117273129 [Nicotiana tomentosiformis]